MKHLILEQWNFFRIFRLVIGLAILLQAIFAKDGMMGIVGALFSIMPILNVGCCGSNGCYIPTKNINKNIQDITYEEVV
jgi:hypothetical protein